MKRKTDNPRRHTAVNATPTITPTPTGWVAPVPEFELEVEDAVALVLVLALLLVFSMEVVAAIDVVPLVVLVPPADDEAGGAEVADDSGADNISIY